MYFLKLQLKFCCQVTGIAGTAPASEDTREYKTKGKIQETNLLLNYQEEDKRIREELVLFTTRQVQLLW